MPKLTLDLSEPIYRRLHAEAERHGRTVEEEVKDLVFDRFPSLEEPAETREVILERMRQRREEMTPIHLTPEELKEWINFGRP